MRAAVMLGYHIHKSASLIYYSLYIYRVVALSIHIIIGTTAIRMLYPNECAVQCPYYVCQTIPLIEKPFGGVYVAEGYFILVCVDNSKGDRLQNGIYTTIRDFIHPCQTALEHPG